jgi:hypothetical protein
LCLRVVPDLDLAAEADGDEPRACGVGAEVVAAQAVRIVEDLCDRVVVGGRGVDGDGGGAGGGNYGLGGGGEGEDVGCVRVVDTVQGEVLFRLGEWLEG